MKEGTIPNSISLDKDKDLLDKIARILLSLALFKYSFDFYLLGLLTEPFNIILTLNMHMLALLLLISTIVKPKLSKFLTRIGMGFLLFGFIIISIKYFSIPHFGTDGILYTRYSLDLLLEGKNPYSYSMLPAYERYGLDYRWTTPTPTGEIVDRFSYPPLGFLIFLPLFVLGIVDLNTTAVLFFVLTSLFLAYELKRAKLPMTLALLVMFFDPILFVYSIGGVSDIIWVFFVLISMKFFYEGRLGTSGIFMGLACLTKQTPWLIIPFSLIYAFRGHKVRDAIRYVLTLIATFAVVSSPFILWDFKSYLEGILEPLTGIPEGIGLSSLVYFGHITLQLDFFIIATAIVFASSLIIYWVNFEKIKHICWVMPPFILWFHSRSLQNYFIFFVPITLYLLIKLKGEFFETR